MPVIVNHEIAALQVPVHNGRAVGVQVQHASRRLRHQSSQWEHMGHTQMTSRTLPKDFSHMTLFYTALGTTNDISYAHPHEAGVISALWNGKRLTSVPISDSTKKKEMHKNETKRDETRRNET